MLDKERLIPYFRKAVILKSPEVETDDAYRFTDDEIWDMILVSIWEHNPAYDEHSFPQNELPFLMLVARKELYFRLATASAPFYPLSAEGAELRKDYRFEHYMSLIRLITKEYDSLLERFRSNIGVEHGVLLKNKYHLRNLQYNDLDTPEFNSSYDIIDDHLIVRWSKFKSIGDKFSSYSVYVSDKELNEFSDLSVLEPVFKGYNIHVNSIKLVDLSQQLYHILIVHESLCGLRGYNCLEVDLRGDEDESIGD